jgi:hypothetical protein
VAGLIESEVAESEMAGMESEVIVNHRLVRLEAESFIHPENICEYNCLLAIRKFIRDIAYFWLARF